MSNFIAVYGTLKKEKHNNYFLKESFFLKKETTGPGYALFVDGLPYLVKRKDGFGCEIEIYEVSNKVLKEIDLLEGHPFFYKRSILKKINNKNVYIYLINNYKEKFLKLDIKSSMAFY